MGEDEYRAGRYDTDGDASKMIKFAFLRVLVDAFVRACALNGRVLGVCLSVLL